VAVVANLQRYIDRINAEENPSAFIAAYVHKEPNGIKSITQQGHSSKKNTKTFRLYIFPDTDTQTLHLLTLGDKPSQADDIKDSKKLLKSVQMGA
jgi:hypothetical protein